MAETRRTAGCSTGCSTCTVVGTVVLVRYRGDRLIVGLRMESGLAVGMRIESESVALRTELVAVR